MDFAPILYAYSLSHWYADLRSTSDKSQSSIFPVCLTKQYRHRKLHRVVGDISTSRTSGFILSVTLCNKSVFRNSYYTAGHTTNRLHTPPPYFVIASSVFNWTLPCISMPICTDRRIRFNGRKYAIKHLTACFHFCSLRVISHFFCYMSYGGAIDRFDTIHRAQLLRNKLYYTI